MPSVHKDVPHNSANNKKTGITPTTEHKPNARNFNAIDTSAGWLEDRPSKPGLSTCMTTTKLSAELEWIPTTTVPVTDEQAEDISKLIERLEEDEDVNKVFHNMG